MKLIFQWEVITLRTLLTSLGKELASGCDFFMNKFFLIFLFTIWVMIFVWSELCQIQCLTSFWHTLLSLRYERRVRAFFIFQVHILCSVQSCFDSCDKIMSCQLMETKNSLMNPESIYHKINHISWYLIFQIFFLHQNSVLIFYFNI